MAPDVDVIVAVHDLRREFVRAVGSALGGEGGADDGGCPVGGVGRADDDGGGRAGAGDPRSGARVRVTVVAHNLEASVVDAALDAGGLAEARRDGRVRVIELADGVPSPAGPFTLGLDRAEAMYVSIMGSDDRLEPGALAAWWRIAEARGSAAVLAPMRLDTGRLIRNPVPRPFAGRWWPAPLDPVRDRLAPRSAPLGLLRREVVERLGLRLTPGLRTGEDIGFSARLWFSGERLDLDRTAPVYVIGTDAAERVSAGAKPVEVELAAVRLLRDEPWVEALGPAQRRALAVAMLRVHVLGAVARRGARGDWADRGGPVGSAGGAAAEGTAVGQDAVVGDPSLEGEARWLAALARDWADLAPGALAPFSRADRLVLDALLAGADVERLSAAGAARAAASRADAVLPQRLRHMVDREGTLRRYVRERMWW